MESDGQTVALDQKACAQRTVRTVGMRDSGETSVSVNCLAVARLQAAAPRWFPGVFRMGVLPDRRELVKQRNKAGARSTKPARTPAGSQN